MTHLERLTAGHEPVSPRDAEIATIDMLPSIALAPSLTSLWEEMRSFCFRLGCPNMGFMDMMGGGGQGQLVASSFRLDFSMDEIRQMLSAGAGAPILLDAHLLALPAFGPRGLEAALIVLLPGANDTPPSWSDSLGIAFQLAYARYRQIRPKCPDEIALSEREREIMLWVTRGKSNSVIASILGISASTVDTYMRRIFRKLNVADRTSAAMRMVAFGVVA